jgi:Sec-independent protein secretion pathway component TatC
VFGDLSSVLDRVASYANRFRRFLARVATIFLTAWCLFTFVPVRPSEWWPPGWVSWVGDSVSGNLLRLMESHLLPAGEKVIVLSPFDPLTVLMGLGAGIAAIVAITYAIAKLMAYAWSGLKASERRMATNLMLWVPALFGAGALLGLWLLPYVFQWCYALAGAAGAQTTVSLTEFVYTALFFVFTVGLSFQIPAVCAGLGTAGILHSSTMRKHWKVATMGTLVLAFLISPGIFGGLVEIPMWGLFMGLYYLGYRVVKRAERTRSQSRLIGALHENTA